MSHLSSTQLALGAAGLVTVVAYGWLILVPAVGCYGRVWEKVAAAFLSLFILATLIGVGVGLGVGGLYLWIEGA
ncbi:MAG: hypothetical protein JOZ25_01750 [Actinobacteria bacterium]|nr:hypothetical protein [Actinomycetota bacterium]